ncbi:MAG: hypothetical protein WCV82_01945 [Candidatus Paceibacterota bacterium]
MKEALVCSFIGLAKFCLAGLVTLFFRLITPLIGLPNATPLMATELASAKAYGPWIGGLYGMFSMVILDAVMGKLESWTIATSLCYGVVGVLGGYYLGRRRASIGNFLLVSIVGTLFFDLVTGILLAPLHGTPMMIAAIGQIPFTLRHLGWNMFFACFAPWFYREIMANISLELRYGLKLA